MASDKFEVELELLKKMMEPDTALIITQNERGEIINAEIVDVNEAYFLLSHAAEAQKPEQRPPSKTGWWSPGED